MANINLLPWREKLRKERQQQFYAILGLGAVCGLLIVLLMHIQMEALIDHQIARNQYLEREIAEMDKRIAEIEKLEETRNALVERMKVIETLQTSRPVVVHLFDEMVTTLPEGVYLTSLTQNGNRLTLTGKADSHARVSSYMQRIDASPWLGKPNLSVIQVGIENGVRVSNFTMDFPQTTPGEAEAGTDTGPAKAEKAAKPARKPSAGKRGK